MVGKIGDADRLVAISRRRGLAAAAGDELPDNCMAAAAAAAPRDKGNEKQAFPPSHQRSLDGLGSKRRTDLSN